jgi:hypothetical protein
VAACRRILGSAGVGLADHDVERLRDQLYALADSIVSAYEGMKESTQQEAELSSVSESDREGIEERAAILECEAHLTRDAADWAAIAAYRRKRLASNAGQKH